MQGNILFDNIYIGHSVEDAVALRKETYDIKRKREVAEDDATKPDDEPSKSPLDVTFKEDPVTYCKELIKLFINIAKQDPVQAIKSVPEVAGGIGVLIVTLLVVLVGGIGGASKSPQVQEQAKKAKDAAVDAKDKAADAVSSGADKVATEANRRTTRSSAAADS